MTQKRLSRVGQSFFVYGSENIFRGGENTSQYYLLLGVKQ